MRENKLESPDEVTSSQRFRAHTVDAFSRILRTSGPCLRDFLGWEDRV